jgi:hypothetical protein
LTEVDVDSRRAVCTHGREEVVLVEPDVGLVELLAVAREENGAGSGSITNADYISFGKRRSVRLGVERVVVALEAVCGEISHRVLVPT